MIGEYSSHFLEEDESSIFSAQYCATIETVDIYENCTMNLIGFIRKQKGNQFDEQKKKSLAFEWGGHFTCGPGQRLRYHAALGQRHPDTDP